MKQRTLPEKRGRVSRTRPEANSDHALSYRRWGACIFLVAMTLIAYLPAMGAGYIWDDDGYVQYNSTLRSLGGLWRLWFEFGATQDYYPLTFTTFWLEYRLWGLAPAGFHLINVLLHAGNAILVWRLLSRLLVPGALFAAAVFALHPVQVESVAWITERKNVLSGMFFLFALGANLRFYELYEQAANRATCAKWYLASLGYFLLAMFSKTVTITLPFVLLAMIWWRRGRLNWRDMVLAIPYFLLAVPMFGLSSIAGANFGGAGVSITGPTGGLWSFSLAEQFILVGRCLWFYAGKLFYPVELSFVYPLFEIDGRQGWQYLFPMTAFGVPMLFVLMRHQWGRGPATAVVVFGLCLAPGAGFLSFYFQRYSFVADHLQYLACIGLISLTVAVVVAGVRRFAAPEAQRWILGVAGAAVLLCLGTLTFQQCFAYQSLEILWRDTIQKNPRCEMAHTNLGLLLRMENRLPEAMQEFERAREIAPRDAAVYNNIATVEMLQGQTDQAIEHFQQALAMNPRHAETCSNLGLAYLAQGREAEGLVLLFRAVELDPKHADVQFNLAAALHERRRLDEAIPHYQAAIKTNPLHLTAHHNLAAVYRAQQKEVEAATYLQRASEIEATNP